jgi:UDP-N-acetylmuramyl tripeptide synthase
MRFTFALWYAKLINKLINLVDKSRGSNLSGEKALKVDPEMVAHFKGIDPEKVLFITGTNGKSSLTNLVNHLLTQQGKVVISNLEGANLLAGIATVLSKESNMRGEISADYFVFETDERFLPLIYAQLPAKHLAITNLQKDQVQRNGDPDTIYRILRSVVNSDMTLYLNNDEPRSKSFEDASNKVVYFGVEKHSESFTKDWTYPTFACPHCHQKISFEYYNTDGVGKFACSHCHFASNDDPGYLLKNVNSAAKTFEMGNTLFDMPYDLPFMLYNYSAALAICEHFAEIPIRDNTKAFADFVNVGGRYEVLNYHGKTIKYLRIKQENPETLQNTLNIIASDPNRKMVCFGLYPLVDIIPHYTNTFYTWDCDFKPLIASDVEGYFCFSNAVCYDTANRLIYEGVDPDDIKIEDTNDVQAIFKTIDEAETDNIYLITWIEDFMKMRKHIMEEEKHG